MTVVLGGGSSSLSDFWFKQLQKVQSQRSQPVPAIQPWWRTVPDSGSQLPERPGDRIQLPKSTALANNEAPAQNVSDFRFEGVCPNCHSENFMSPQPNIAPRCLDCNFTTGHNSPSLQFLVRSEGPAQPTRQIKTPPYQPGVVIDRIG